MNSPIANQILSSKVYGRLLRYVESVDKFQKVEQKYLDRNYQTVHAHRVPAGSDIEDIVIRNFMKFNEEYFKYDLSGTFEVQLLKYLPGCHYDWHADYGVSECPPDVRKLSMSIQISNTWEYNGCDVYLRDWYNNSQHMEREAGAVTVFDSKVPHKITRLTDGIRYSLIAWAHGPELK